jgi:hypothetical protein
MLTRDGKIMLKVLFFITIILGIMTTAGMVVLTAAN